MKTAYNIYTGEIVGSGTHVDHMCTSEISIIDGYCDLNAGYVKNGELIKYTSKELDRLANKPNYMSTWDFEKAVWIDSRNEKEVRDSKYQQIKDMAIITELSNIIIDNKEYSADQNTRNIITQKLFTAILSNNQEYFNVEWKLVDNNTINLNFEALKQILIRIELRSSNIYTTKQKLKEQIYSCDIDKLSTIRWPDFV